MPSLLIDTHALIWLASDPEKLGRNAFQALRMRSTHVLVSTASFWEMAIKISLGHLKLDIPLEDLTGSQMSERGITILPISEPHILALSQLEIPRNGHRDPIDRTLIAQAMVERLDLVSADSALDAYAVTRIW